MAASADWLDPDRAHANGAFIRDAEGYPAAWAAKAAAFRDRLGQRLSAGIPYGPDERQSFDLMLPEATPRGLLVFVHGGYWMAFGRESWSHLAGGALARGWACAMPSYRLAPQVSLADMTRDVASAVLKAAALVNGPVVVTGHSAGGHLSARMACADGPAVVVRVVPISPLAELEPLIATGMQQTLRITPEICAAESPARLQRRPGIDAHVWVGGHERPSFLWQARVLSEAWGCPWTVAPGRHHFDVIDELEEPGSGLTAACLDGL